MGSLTASLLMASCGEDRQRRLRRRVKFYQAVTRGRVRPKGCLASTAALPQERRLGCK
jgi:hypothetical protein